jgi:hypothetical protein
MLLALQTTASPLSFEVGVDDIGAVAFGALRFFFAIAEFCTWPDAADLDVAVVDADGICC